MSAKARTSNLKASMDCEDCGSHILVKSYEAHQQSQKCKAARRKKLADATKRAEAQELKARAAGEELVDAMSGRSKASFKTSSNKKKAAKGGESSFELKAAEIELEMEMEAKAKKTKTKARVTKTKAKPSGEAKAKTKGGGEDGDEVDDGEEEEEEEGEEKAGGESSDYDQEDENEEENQDEVGDTSSSSSLSAPKTLTAKDFTPPLGTGAVTPQRTYRDVSMILALYLQVEKVTEEWGRRINALQNNQKSPKLIQSVKEFLIYLINAEVFHLKSVRDHLLSVKGQCTFDPNVGRYGDPAKPKQAEAVRNAYNLAATAATVLGNEDDERRFDEWRIKSTKAFLVKTELDNHIVIRWVHTTFFILGKMVHKFLQKPMPVSLKDWQPPRGYLISESGTGTKTTNQPRAVPTESTGLQLETDISQPEATPASDSI